MSTPPIDLEALVVYFELLAEIESSVEGGNV